jgi:hypothetical protein
LITFSGKGAACWIGDGSPGELRGTGLCHVHFCAPRITWPPVVSVRPRSSAASQERPALALSAR